MFHKEEYTKFIDAGYMSKDPKQRQEVFSDGDHISGNSLEPGGCLPARDLVEEQAAHQAAGWRHPVLQDVR